MPYDPTHPLHFASGCQGKIRYDTAKAAMRGIRRPGRGNLRGETVKRGKIRPYSCNYCGFFHVGHSGRKRDVKKPTPKEKRIEIDE